MKRLRAFSFVGMVCAILITRTSKIQGSLTFDCWPNGADYMARTCAFETYADCNPYGADTFCAQGCSACGYGALREGGSTCSVDPGMGYCDEFGTDESTEEWGLLTCRCGPPQET